MLPQNPQIIVHTLTHGPHQKGAETVEDYDGPLTDEGREMVKRITLPSNFDRVYCGDMERHRDTARAVLPNPSSPIVGYFPACGDDKTMFAALVQGEELEMVRGLTRLILDAKNDDRFKEILLITSRGYAALMAWIMAGGEPILGKFSAWYNALDKAMKAKELDAPCNRQATIARFVYRR